MSIIRVNKLESYVWVLFDLSDENLIFYKIKISIFYVCLCRTPFTVYFQPLLAWMEFLDDESWLRDFVERSLGSFCCILSAPLLVRIDVNTSALPLSS